MFSWVHTRHRHILVRPPTLEFSCNLHTNTQYIAHLRYSEYLNFLTQHTVYSYMPCLGKVNALIFPHTWMFWSAQSRHLHILVDSQHLNNLTNSTPSPSIPTQCMYTTYLNILAHTKLLNVLMRTYPTPVYSSTPPTLEFSCNWHTNSQYICLVYTNTWIL
jgi:hypothetical protein